MPFVDRRRLKLFDVARPMELHVGAYATLSHHGWVGPDTGLNLAEDARAQKENFKGAHRHGQ